MVMNRAPVVMLVVLMVIAVGFALHYRGQLDQKTALLAETDRKAQEIDGLLKASNRSVASLESRIDDLEQGLTAFDQLGQRLEAALEEIGDLKTREFAITSENRQLQERLNAGLEARSAAEETVQRQAETIAALQSQLADAQHRKGKTEAEAQAIAAAYADLKNRLQEEINSQDAVVAGNREAFSVTFVNRILFDSGNATISKEGRAILDEVVQALAAIQDKTIRIVGHTDNIPIAAHARHIYPSNWELSATRAAAVVRHIQETGGINPAGMELVGRSHYQPFGPNDTDQARARNRRVEIVVAPKVSPVRQ
jgi:chemotaxis protein MotB